MISELRALVRERTEGRYELLGEIAGDANGVVVCLARESGEHALVAVAVRRMPTAAEGSGGYEIEVLPALDDSILAVQSVCDVCGSVAESDTSCGNCGTAIGPPVRHPLAGQSATAAMRAVREAAGAAFEILGEMPRGGGSGSLYFAREIATGRLVPLGLRNAVDEEGGEFLSLGVTRVVLRPGAIAAHDVDGISGVAGASAEGSSRRDQVPADGTTPGTPGKVCPTCSREFPLDARFCPTDGSTLLVTGIDQGLIGRTIAERYHIRELIGEGGFGKVYLAEHARMGRLCAVKIINPSMRNDADVVGRFSREAANASRINHANIATVYDFGETDDGLIYLVMEYVPGDTLAQTLGREKPLPAWRAAEIARQIADALIAAHALGIVHRDLKPQNIILARGHDGGEVVKVVDFGIAKAVQGDAQEITRAGFVIGTLEYMSPEQLLGTNVDGRSDVYSLGCVLFEMLTGQSAFAGPDGPISIGRRMSEAPARVRDRNADIPGELDEIVAMALAHDPAERFQTAEGLRDALDGILRGGTAERRGLIRRGTAEERRVERPASAASGEVVRAAAPTSPPTPAASVQGPAFEQIPARPAALQAVGASVTGNERVPRSEKPRRPVAMVLAGVAVVVTLAAGYRALTAGSGGSAMVPTSHVAPSAATFAQGGPDASGPAADRGPATPGGVTGESATIHLGATIPGDAVVTVDGRTNSERSLTVSPGAHRLRVAAPGYVAIDTMLTVASGQVVTWNPQLRPDAGGASAGAPTPASASRASSAGTPPSTGAPAAAEAPSVPALVIDPPVGVAATSSPAPRTAAAEPPPVPAATSPADARDRIVAGLERFARALESRRIEAVAVAYPGMTQTERSTWGGFIDGVRTLRVAVADVRVPGAFGETILVPFSMRFDFTDQRGANQSTQRYQATFVQLAGDWRIEAIRPE